MFKVRAVEDKNEQKRLCRSCNTEYFEELFAYAAYDVMSADDGCGEIIGVCQFTFLGECRIRCLAPADGKESDEAMLILGFAVLEFFRRCGFTAVLGDIPECYAPRLGFVKKDGVYSLDLKAPRACGGH